MIPEQQIDQPLSLSMAPYSGPWTKDEAAHLLRRSLFGPTFNQISQSVIDGMNSTVSQLLSTPTFDSPLVWSADETIAAQGTSWVQAVYPSDIIESDKVENARRESLAAWIMQRINEQGLSVHEKMCLFWQNHFGVEATFDSRASFDYFRIIQNAALGNFKQLLKDITTNPMMLIFLNGAENNKFFPNENYARELLELFSIGKGEQVGVGDYTNYTETDVAMGAKVLTGWTVSGFRSNTETVVTSSFVPALHDTSTKTFSNRLGNASITNADANEYANYIDLIFQQPETAKYICRKLYRWFVNYDLTAAVETTVIQEMADALVAANFEILPVLDMLFKSEHFYDISVRGAIIKNPLEHVFSMYNGTGARPNVNANVNGRMLLNVYWIAFNGGMNYLTPPSVAGWSAFYQVPSFSKNWINSAYIKFRFDVASYITLYGGIDVDGFKFPIDHLNFVNTLSNPSDSAQIIEDIVTIFCPKGLSASQKTALQVILLNGLPDFEWTIQYGEYLLDPSNQTLADALKLRVALVLDQVFKLPEFQTL